MLRIFVSSTFRDLKTARMGLLNRINASLQAVGMEFFIPDGSSSHEKCIAELKKSDIIIFLISSKYGSLIDKCTIEGCKANCQMHKRNEKISYTHCEFKVALAEKKPHMTYLLEGEWELINQLNKLKGKSIDWDKISKNPSLSILPKEKISSYYKIRKKIEKFRKEIGREFLKIIENYEDPKQLTNLISTITNHLAENIIKWYKNGNINIKDYSGRRKELALINNKLNESIEVYGVGGIGKTTLIQISLLIQKLKGKRIKMLGFSQSYLTGSGYHIFKEKCREDLKEIKLNKINLEEILFALSIEPDSNFRKLNEYEQIDRIINTIRNENIILFIDDFNFADENVNLLIKKNSTIIISSRRKVDIARNGIYLKGIKDSERTYLIDIICQRLGIEISNEIKKIIAKITEGHPVSTELLIRNYEKIDFRRFKDFKSSIFLSNPGHMDEFLKRVVEEILGEQAYDLVKHIAVINTNIENNLNREILERTSHNSGFNTLFNELIDAGMIQKKGGSESEYQFNFRHIQDVLRSDDKNIHKYALNYYEDKIKKDGTKIDDLIEKFFHKFKIKIESNSLLDFLAIQKQISPSHHSFARFFKVLLGIEYKKEDIYMAEIYLVRGNLSFDLRKYETAKENYEKAIEVWTKLAHKDEELITNIIMIQNNLALVYETLGKLNEAKTKYKEILNLRISYSTIRPNAYLQDIATVLFNLGRLYHDLNKLSKSELYYMNAMRIFETLTEENPEEFLSSFSKCFHNIGMLYRTQRKFDDSEEFYFKAIEIIKVKYNENPEKYTPELASSHNSLGNLYWNSKQFEKAEREYKKSIELYNSLIDKNPEIYSLYLGCTKTHLGVCFTDDNQFVIAENELIEALDILNKYNEINPTDYTPYIAATKYNLGYLFYKTNRNIKAKSILKEALELYKELSKNAPEPFEDMINKIQEILELLD